MALRFHTSLIKSPGMMATGLVCGRCQQSASVPAEQGAQELVTGEHAQYMHMPRRRSPLATVGVEQYRHACIPTIMRSIISGTPTLFGILLKNSTELPGHEERQRCTHSIFIVFDEFENRSRRVRWSVP